MSFPRVIACHDEICSQGSPADLVRPLEMANYLVAMGVEVHGQSEEDYAEIVEDINAIVCSGAGGCQRLAALQDALSEMGVYDAIALDRNNPVSPAAQTAWQLGWLEVERANISRDF